MAITAEDLPMLPVHSQWRQALLAALVCVFVVTPRLVPAADDPALTKEQMKTFLRTAKVIKEKQSQKGTTNPWRLTLSDGKITHDASFQAIDEHRIAKEFSTGEKELHFVDSYKYNVAGYILAELLGVDDMVPVYVERKWRGNTGSISWWLPVKMDEGERLKKKIQVPDQEAWNKQMYRLRVFDALIYDTDVNLTNVLIDEDWKVYRVDFSRAFRLSPNLKDPRDLVKCDRQLFAKLKALDGNELAARTKPFLTREELKGVMARRDKIIAYFEQLIREHGEAQLLY